MVAVPPSRFTPRLEALPAMHLPPIARRSATLLALIGFAACDSTRTAEPTASSVRPGPSPAFDAIPTTKEILVDNFTDGSAKVGNGSWWGYALQPSLSGVIGATRELGWYNNGTIKVDAAAHTMEWGVNTQTSPQFSVSYGTGIGISVAPRTAISPNTGQPLNLNLSTNDKFVVDLTQVTSSAPLRVTL